MVRFEKTPLFNSHNSEIRTFDFEAENWTKLRMAGLYNGICYNQIYLEKNESQEDLVNYVISHMETQGGIWYAHYGGKYDLIFLISRLYERFNKTHILDIIYINGKILSFKVKDKRKTLFEIRDSSGLINSSLDSACKSFNIKTKKLAEIDRKNLFSKYDYETLTKYLMHDCISLFEVLEEFKKSLEIKTLKLTIASTALAKFKEIEGKTFTKKYNLSYDRRDEFIRLGYSGGRCEIFKRYGKGLYYYDVKSMYPSVMYDNYFPSGKLIKTNRYMENYLGIYKIKFSVADTHIPLLWVKQNKKLYFPQGEKVIGWYYSPEIEQAYKSGYNIEILEGYYWENKIKIFKSYIEKYYTIKENSKDAKKATAKLLLNSLYGKFGQKETRQKFSFNKPSLQQLTLTPYVCDRLNNVELFRCDETNKADYILPQLAGFTTSYARVKLYNYMQKIGFSHIYYSDTDSIVSDVTTDTGHNLGDLELKDKLKEGVFLLPKIYSVINSEGENYIRAKGFRIYDMNIDHEKMYNCLDFQYFKKYFTQEKERVANFLEYFTRLDLNHFGETLIDKKSIKSEYSKRIICEDGVNTTPLVF